MGRQERIVSREEGSPFTVLSLFFAERIDKKYGISKQLSLTHPIDQQVVTMVIGRSHAAHKRLENTNPFLAEQYREAEKEIEERLDAMKQRYSVVGLPNRPAQIQNAVNFLMSHV